MDKRLLTLLLVCMCATFGIQARTVKGTVVDKVNQPVIGASVHVNGTNLGAMTDVDGNFTISNAPDNAVLTFSYVGMVSKTVKAADGQMKIELADDVQNLEEVVVIGYGAAKAKDLTAPIEVVKGEKLIATPIIITNDRTPRQGGWCEHRELRYSWRWSYRYYPRFGLIRQHHPSLCG